LSFWKAMLPPLEIDFARLWERVTAQYRCGLDSIHGPAHWRRVEQTGLLLAKRTGAEIVVVRLFAVFHDSCRTTEGWDEGHGARGAALSEQLRGELFEILDVSFKLLHEACAWHTDGKMHADPTIGTCWDADRLDLGRVGILPDEKLMSTEFGKEIARGGSAFPFL
jgi:uncharacterized protein